MLLFLLGLGLSFLFGIRIKLVFVMVWDVNIFFFLRVMWIEIVSYLEGGRNFIFDRVFG